jgi:hypothetical protein
MRYKILVKIMVSFSCGTEKLQTIPNIKVRKDEANGLKLAGRNVTSYSK